MDYINGKSERYDFISINLGTNSLNRSSIENFPTYLDEERLIFDINNNPIKNKPILRIDSIILSPFLDLHHDCDFCR